MKLREVRPRQDPVFLVLVIGRAKMTAKPFASKQSAVHYANRRRENARKDELPLRIEIHRIHSSREATHGELIEETITLPGGSVAL